jgi:hypothetical protein
VLSPPGTPQSFDLALIPGVFIGPFLAAAAVGRFEIRFRPWTPQCKMLMSKSP